MGGESKQMIGSVATVGQQGAVWEETGANQCSMRSENVGKTVRQAWVATVYSVLSLLYITGCGERAEAAKVNLNVKGCCIPYAGPALY